MWRVVSISLAAALLLGAAKGKPGAGGLAAKLQQTLDKVEAAHVAGDTEGAARILAPAVSAMKEETARQFDEELAARKLPSFRELLVDARLKLLMENRAGALPAPSLRERLLLLEALPGRVQGPLKTLAEEPLLKEEDASPPQDLEEYDQRFKDIRRLAGRLRLAAACAAYAAELAAQLPATARKKLTDEKLEFLAQCEGGLAAKVAESVKQLRELELETHLARLTYGVEALREPRLTKEKFMAAASTRLDSRILKEALAPAPAAPQKKGKRSAKPASDATADVDTASALPTFARAGLNRDDLADEVENLTRQAQELAGPLGAKAERFYAGLDAWVRGRYGWGPDVWGLAKSVAALKDPALLQRVYMPEEMPSADASSKRTQRSDFPDRRHHYIWAWEDRTLATSMSGDRFHEREVVMDYRAYDDLIPRISIGPRIPLGPLPLQVTEVARESERAVTVPPQDPRLVYRIVGFMEYVEALQHLDQFVEEATPAEFEVAEELLKSRDEFCIETNLSRPLEKGSTLSEKSDNPRDDFRRHGLEWVMALARVELGAMLAGFTSHENPFLGLAPKTFRQERVKTRPFGEAAFAELLLDGLRTHYWSLIREDVIARDYRNGVPENHLLTYSRRAIVGQHFLHAVLRYGGGGNVAANLPVARRKELESWEQTFVKLYRMMLYCLTFKVGKEKSTLYTYPGFGWYGQWGPPQRSTTERDQTPDAIRQILTTADPTLIGCGCKLRETRPIGRSTPLRPMAFLRRASCE